MELVDDDNSLLVVAKSTLFKVELDSCSSFKSCEQCVLKSPHCGWCAGECTTVNQCKNPASWLTASSSKATITSAEAQSMCMEIASVQPSRKFKYDNEWIEVEFKRELGTITAVNSTFECVFRNEIIAASDESGADAEELHTDAILISPTKIKCSLPHLSKIKFRYYPKSQSQLLNIYFFLKCFKNRFEFFKVKLLH